MLGALARTGMPIVDVEAGCASGGAALQLAAGAIRAGQYDCVLVFGIEKMPKGIIRSSFFEPWREEAGLAATPAYFALRAQRLLRESGLTKEHLAEVVVKNRRHGVHNPNAMFRKEVDRRGGARVARRVRAAAPLDAVLAQRRRRRDRAAAARPTPTASAVTLASARLRSHLPGSVLGEATPLSGIDDADITPPSTLAADDAYEEAGIGPDDVDVVECQDTDAARELLAYQELGLCAPGEQAALLADGRDRARRRPAVNPAAACCRRASRSARRRSARSSSSCTSSAARPGRARSTARGSASRTPSAGAPNASGTYRDSATQGDGMGSHLCDVWFHITELEVVSGSGCMVTHRRRRGVPRLHARHRGREHRALPPAGRRRDQRAGRHSSSTRRPTATAARCPSSSRRASRRSRPPSIDTFFFANSGAEATEAAVKLARHATQPPERDRRAGRVPRPHVSDDGDDHVEDRLPRRLPTAPRRHLRRPRSRARSRGTSTRQTAVERALADLRLLLLTQTAPSETAAFVIEPVLGEGGYLPAPIAFVQGVREICDEHGILFVADEVQTGFARTGRMFAVEHAGVEPDIIVMAKGIASGFPIAGIGARPS